MKTLSNPARNCTKATIKKVLRSIGINQEVFNCGDNRTFYIYDNSLKVRIAIKKAGFVLCRALATDPACTFKTY